MILVDPDETPSLGLLARLPSLTDAEAYVVPRYEEGARGYTYHLRLFRCHSTHFRGPSHGDPQVDGHTKVLSRSLSLAHRTASGKAYWTHADRIRRNFLSDELSRPYDFRYLREIFRSPRASARSGPTAPDTLEARRLPPALIPVALALEAGREIATTGSIGLARFSLGSRPDASRDLGKAHPRLKGVVPLALAHDPELRGARGVPGVR